MEVFLGDRFFLNKKIDNAEDYDIRIMRIKSPTKFIARRGNGETVSITKDIIEKEYKRLTPQGTIFFSTVAMNTDILGKKDTEKDVIISLYRMRDTEKKQVLPFLICRQFITDSLSQICNNNPIVRYVGMCITMNTFPTEEANIDLARKMVSCDKLLSTIKVNVYMNDTLKSILQLVPKKYIDNMNEILSTLKKRKEHLGVYGYMENVEDLLVRNDFEQMFLSAFNVYKVPYEITEWQNEPLTPEHREDIEILTRCQVLDSSVFEYSFEINMDRIQSKYIIISDTTNKLYIITYREGKDISDNYNEKIIQRNKDIAEHMPRMKKLLESSGYDASDYYKRYEEDNK